VDITVDGKNSRPAICFISSPGIGILDNWLPPILRLKQVCPELDIFIIFPKAGPVELLDPENINLIMSDDIFTKKLVYSHLGHWISAPTYSSAQSLIKPSSIQAVLLKFAVKFERFSLGFIGKLFRYLGSIITTKKYRQAIVSLPEELKPSRAVLYDINDEFKSYNDEILSILGKTPRFSIYHGIHINLSTTVPEVSVYRSLAATTCYLYSEMEKQYYRNAFQIDDSQLRVIGVPRHEKAWIKMLSSSSNQEKDWEDYVFIISRSMSEYLPYDRKMEALRIIKSIIVDELGMKVIVKFHPKERFSNQYESVFGRSMYGTTWKYSSAHPLVLGRKCKFAISFLSGVAVDMLALGKPVIEYLDLKGIPAYDNDKSLRDSNGNPVLSYRYLGLVLGADDELTFRKQVNKITDDPVKSSNFLMTRYRDIFADPDGAAEIISGDILSVLKGKS